MNDIKSIIEGLRNELNNHNYLYYVKSLPEISDYDYDILMKELIDLENNHPEYFDQNSPTQRVGSDISEEFKQVEHKYLMLSLGNTYSEEEIKEFDNRVRKTIGEDFTYACELKFDGTAIGLSYKNGVLIQAVTRGDGTRGDDVSSNVKTIKSVPLKLLGNEYPDEFEIRGEIYYPHEGFNQLNKERTEEVRSLFN